MYNILKSKVSRSDALCTLGKEFKISVEFFTTKNN